MSTSVNRSAGFTLIELLVVLGIMALVTLLLLPAIPHQRKSAATDAVQRLEQRIGLLSREAIATGRTTQLTQADAVGVASWQPDMQGEVRRPQFFPDGSAIPGVASLANGRRVHISWIDGHVSTVQ